MSRLGDTCWTGSLKCWGAPWRCSSHTVERMAEAGLFYEYMTSSQSPPLDGRGGLRAGSLVSRRTVLKKARVAGTTYGNVQQRHHLDWNTLIFISLPTYLPR